MLISRGGAPDQPSRVRTAVPPRVITGGAGFIASHVVDALLAEGEHVLVIDDLSTGKRDNLRKALQHFGDNLEFCEADIREDKASQAISAFRPDSLMHFAAQINVRKSVEDTQFDAEVNVLGMVRMLEAAKRARAKNFIFASTGGAIYGEQEYFPADEEHPTRSKSPYGVSKRAGELYLEYYANEGAFRGVSLRFSNVYGPRQNPRGEAGVVAIFTERLFANAPLVVNGDGEQTRDFIYVEDIVEACLATKKADSRPTFEIFNVGRGQEVSVNEIVNELASAWSLYGTHGRSSFKVENGPALAGEQMRSVIDPKKIREELGWQPKMELSKGIRATIESFAETS